MGRKRLGPAPGLPSGFVRIRRYGILSNRLRGEKMALCRTAGAGDTKLLGVARDDPGPSENAAVDHAGESVSPLWGWPADRDRGIATAANALDVNSRGRIAHAI